MPELTGKLWSLAQAGQIEQARNVQFHLMELFDTMIYSVEFPEGIRAAVSLRGFKMGRGRQPLSESQELDIARLKRTLQGMLTEYGSVQP